MSHFEQKPKSLEDQIPNELSLDELNEVSGGFFGVEVEIEDVGGLISEGMEKADEWRRTDSGPNILRRIGSGSISAGF